MIVVLTTNEHGKIELTPEELESLLQKSYQEGYEKQSRTVNIPYQNPHQLINYNGYTPPPTNLVDVLTNYCSSKTLSTSLKGGDVNDGE